MLAIPARRSPSEIQSHSKLKTLSKMDVLMEADASFLKGKEFHRHRLILTKTKLICRPQEPKKNRSLVEFSIKLADVLISHFHEHLKDCGKFRHERQCSCIPCRTCCIAPSSSQVNYQEGVSAFLTVVSFPYNKPVRENGVRKKKENVFLFEVESSPVENLRVAREWRDKIWNLCSPKNDVERDERGGGDATDSAAVKKRKFLVCINPFSGPGNAKQIYARDVQPLFKEADIEVEELVTKRQNHARELAAKVEYKEYDAVIIVSGDGLVFEWLNGIMERPDRDQAISLPMGIIPAGSGNALAAAVLSSKKEQYFKNAHLHSAFCAAKGQSSPMDVVEVHYGNKTVYSFLAVVWGIISDIDIESEWLRFIGSPRFTIQAFIRIINLRKYNGRLSYLPAEGYEYRKDSTTLMEGSNDGEAIGSKLPLVTSNSVSVQAGDGIINPSFERQDSSSSEQSTSNDPASCRLPSLSEPVPSNWKVIEGKFICIAVLQDSHLSRDVIAWPNRAFSEGVMCIQYVLHSATRSELFNVMTDMEHGTHMGKDTTKSVFAKAFRIEPMEDDGIITVDGEKVEFGPIQGQMMDLKANILIPS